MAAPVFDFRVNYHYEAGGKVITSHYVDHVQLASRVLSEYGSAAYVAHPTADAIRTVLAANGRAYPGATIVIDGVATMSTATGLLA